MAATDLIVGIDLGTTNSLVGAMDAGFPILLADAGGRRLTPSVVYFPADGGTAVVGAEAAARRIDEPERTVYSVKRLVGTRTGELDTADLAYAVGGATGGPARVKIGGEERSPEEISALVLGKLKADAERALGQPVTRAVITVPAYFNDAQRQATKHAGTLAGLQVERIINEPTAAALAYGLDRLGDRSKIAVYDLGGGTFDISILELNAGVFQVLSTNGNTRLGGDDVDAAFLKSVARHLEDIEKSLAKQREAEPDLPVSNVLERAKPARLGEVARHAKVQLSTQETVALEVGELTGGAIPATMVLNLTRRDLEAAARPVVERTRAHCLRALADAKLSPGALDAVILVGGATRMPLVRVLVAEIFGREPDTSQNPDEAVALGATIQAGVLSGAVRDVVLLDITPLSLGIETFGGLTNVIIPRNTTIPAKAGEMFTNAVAGQRAVRIHVVQGEREKAADNWTLGGFELDFTAGPRGSARVGVQFEIDADGILHVLARDTKTGEEKIVEMRSAVDVSDVLVEQMIAESVEHAFEDYHARLLVETKLKSREMLPAVRHALELAGGRLTAEERAALDRLTAEVEAALPGEDLERLKAANAALDAGTQDLATLLMEQAMDEALERRGVVGEEKDEG